MEGKEELQKNPTALAEEEILERWKRLDIFKKTLAKESPEGEFVFYEGPPTANGRPGIHHLISRAFKDVIPRYKTMRGFHVSRKGGWDTHGLPVEIETEKMLGLKSKKDIEAYGIARFNEKCKESVWTYVNEWREFTERVGYWVDIDNAYVTYYPQYIESVWNIVKQVNEQNLLYQDYKVLPWCPRCGTALSSHEVAQGYEDVKDLSVYIKFKVKGEENTYLLAWTTTPWTLAGNVALAVGEKIAYVYVEQNRETLILAKDRLAVLDGEYTVLKEVTGKELLGLEYEPLYPYLSELVSGKEKEKLSNAFKVYPADFVTTTDGTGIVHTAVMYGADDFVLGTAVGLPKFHLVDETGHFIKGTGELEGLPVKDREDGGLATAIVVLKYLQEKGAFFKKEQHQHTYPFCWRCHTPLIYYARTSWYIAMSKLRDKLVKENEKINWIPEHIREGRFGEWLREVKDWAVSRDRYWGTPLPVWHCEACKHSDVVGSLKELLEKQKHSGNTYTVLRHGESVSNAENVMSGEAGDAEDKLTEKGKEEVREVAKSLKKKKFDLIVTSNFTRTKETAEILAEHLGIKGVVVDQTLHEIGLGPLDGKSFYETGIFFSGENWYTNKPDGGESHADVYRRVANFLFNLDTRYSEKNILIVTHGAPAQLMVAAAQGATPETMGEVFKLFKETAEYHDLSFVPYPHNERFELDLHKPYIDSVELPCPKCGAVMKRTPEVMDVWFDSGAVPFAQHHYPFENKKWIEGKGFPAQYISEAIDQTRGWFYTLHAVGVLMGRGHAFENVICLGHILDSKGKKMSKSIGNVINPWEAIAKFGVDPLRFWMFSVNQPGDSKNFDEKTVDDVIKKVFTVLRNVVKFYELYAGEASEAPRSSTKPSDSPNPLDLWILARLSVLVRSTTEHLDTYHTHEPSRDIRDFVNDLSTWYVRRSRDRFKVETRIDADTALLRPSFGGQVGGQTQTDAEKDKQYALVTLRHVLLTLAKLMAPFIPFFADEIYARVSGEKESVHLEDWPEAKKPDTGVLANMNEVRRIVSLALEARMNAGIKIRQPLQTLTVRNPKSEIRKNDGLLGIIKDELNIKEVVFDDSEGWEVQLDTVITPELKREGELRELTRALQDFRKESNLTASDKVSVSVIASAEGKELIEENKQLIMNATNLTNITATEGNTGEKIFIFSIEK